MTFVCFVSLEVYEQFLLATQNSVKYMSEELADAGVPHRLLHVGSTNIALAPTIDLPGYDLWRTYREADVVRALAQRPVSA